MRLLILLALVTYGDCLKCYDCQSIYGEENPCTKPKQGMEKECTIDNLPEEIKTALRQAVSVVPFNCFKYLQRVSNNTVLIRGCQIKIGEDFCGKLQESQRSGETHLVHCSLCDYDGCNSSSKPTPLIFVVVSVTLHFVSNLSL